MADKKYFKEYAILGRYRKDTKFHTVAGGPLDKIFNKTDAESRLLTLKERASKEMSQKRSTVQQAGFFAISIPHDSDYDLVEFRLIEREVSNWETIQRVETISYDTEQDKDIKGMMENGAKVVWASNPETAADDVHQILEYGINRYLLTLKRLEDGCLHVTHYEQMNL